MEKIKLKWEVVDLPNKQKLIIPDCLKCRYTGRPCGKSLCSGHDNGDKFEVES